MRWAVFLVASACSIGCFSGDRCVGLEPCDEPPEVQVCEGGCVPFIGGAWSPVLVARTRGERPSCPPDAPFETMSSEAPPLTACGVLEAPGGCSTPGYACLPAEPGWTVCVVRDGEHACKWPYEELVKQPDEMTTLCCPREEPPA